MEYIDYYILYINIYVYVKSLKVNTLDQQFSNVLVPEPLYTLKTKSFVYGVITIGIYLIKN